MSGDQDVLMDLEMCRRQVAEYRQALAEMKTISSPNTKHDQDTEKVEADQGVTTTSEGGVRLVVIEGAGHHIQNDVQQNEAAGALLNFVRQC